MLELERLDRMSGALADDVELALECVGHRHATAAADEHLADHRLELDRGLREIGVVDRHVAPAEQLLAFVLDGALDLVFAGDARGRVARQEHHADAVLARGRQLHALLRHFLAIEAVGDLDQEARAVGEFRVPAYRAAMGEVAQHRQSLLDDGVRLPALDVRDEADAARVVLVFRTVQALGLYAHALLPLCTKSQGRPSNIPLGSACYKAYCAAAAMASSTNRSSTPASSFARPTPSSSTKRTRPPALFLSSAMSSRQVSGLSFGPLVGRPAR